MLKNGSKLFLVVAVGLLAAPQASAQDPIPFVPSPMYVVQKMIEVAEIKQGDILYDMGSGDGRIIIEAAKKYGVKGVGIDLNAELIAKAREFAAQEGVSHLVEFRAQDGLTVDISEATVVMLYMFKWFNNALRPKLQSLRPGSRVVAHDFDIDDWQPSRVEFIDAPTDGTSDQMDSRTLYIWKIGGTPTVP